MRIGFFSTNRRLVGSGYLLDCFRFVCSGFIGFTSSARKARHWYFGGHLRRAQSRSADCRSRGVQEGTHAGFSFNYFNSFRWLCGCSSRTPTTTEIVKLTHHGSKIFQISLVLLLESTWRCGCLRRLRCVREDCLGSRKYHSGKFGSLAGSLRTFVSGVSRPETSFDFKQKSAQSQGGV